MNQDEIEIVDVALYKHTPSTLARLDDGTSLLENHKISVEYSVPHKNKLFKLKILIIKMFFDIKAAKTGCTKSRHGLYMQ